MHVHTHLHVPTHVCPRTFPRAKLRAHVRGHTYAPPLSSSRLRLPTACRYLRSLALVLDAATVLIGLVLVMITPPISISFMRVWRAFLLLDKVTDTPATAADGLK